MATDRQRAELAREFEKDVARHLGHTVEDHDDAVVRQRLPAGYRRQLAAECVGERVCYLRIVPPRRLRLFVSEHN